jgi:protein TonB
MNRPELLRWTACAALVLAAHGLIALAIAARPAEVDLEAGAPVVMIELAPIAAAPRAPPEDVAPGPQQMSVESQERPAEEARPEQQPPEEEKRDTPEVPAPEATVALPPPVVVETVKPIEEARAEPEPLQAAPVPTAPPSIAVPADAPAAPAVSPVVSPTSQVVASWQRRLAAHLERFKRYPPRAHGEHGTASVAFTIDHEGRVSGLRIVKSSGSDILDSETLAMIRRAEPLPAPPGGIANQELSFVVPIRYAASR